VDHAARIAHQWLRQASLPKIPGVSAKRLQKMVDELKADIVLYATDAYHEATWVASWRITEGEAMTYRGGEPGFEVTGAVFVGAHGGMDEPMISGVGRFRPKEIRDGLPDLVGPAVAKAVSGKWTASASFGWEEGTAAAHYSSASKVGDLFDSESDSFHRWGVEATAKTDPSVHAVKVPITMKVRASYRKRDGSIRVVAEFTA
jgi:hypothetical protein